MKYCETKVKVPCLYCNKEFTRKDAMKAHVKKFHSEAAKRKAVELAELSKLEVLHADKVPRLNVEEQIGGAVTTRGMKRTADQEETKSQIKLPKPEITTPKNSIEFDVHGEKPLFVANVTKLGPAKRRKQNAVVNQKFVMSLDQQRSPKESEDLNIEATYAIADATDKIIEELKIPEDYWMTLQIGSKEHRRRGAASSKISVP